MIVPESALHPSEPQNSEDLSDLVLPRMCLDSDPLGCPRSILRRSAVQFFPSLLLELLLSSGVLIPAVVRGQL